MLYYFLASFLMGMEEKAVDEPEEEDVEESEDEYLDDWNGPVWWVEQLLMYKHIEILLKDIYFHIWQVAQTWFVAMFYLKYQHHCMSDYLLIYLLNCLIVGSMECHNFTQFFVKTDFWFLFE